ncbi:MAG: succinylglutamate desuccinylase/aspartoacylase family protein [Bacteroidota bacterium]
MSQFVSETRPLGQFEGKVGGPLLIVICQMHGNEPAGTTGFRTVLRLLHQWQSDKGFDFYGRMVGFIGNMAAHQQGIRYQEFDLNRIWKEAHIERARKYGTGRFPEYKELLELHALIQQEIDSYPAEQVFIMDMHTTTAKGGVFTVPGPSQESQDIISSIHAPTVNGLLDFLSGTLMQYVDEYFPEKNITAAAFESGQHILPSSGRYATAGILTILCRLRMIPAMYLENEYNEELTTYASMLPMQTKLVYRHAVNKGDEFRMLPGFKNFTPITKGMLLAHDKKGEILSPYTGYMLMPLYQERGDDGFFVVEEGE